MKIEKALEESLKILSQVSTSNDSENTSGSKLIGHRPDIAPKAFTHVLYRKLSDQEIIDLEFQLGNHIPEQLKSIYKTFNGMMVYLGSIRLLGYIPLNEKNVGIHNTPSNIVIPNVSARLKGLSPKDIVFAWYKIDGSYAVLDDTGCVRRYDVINGGHELGQWQDIGDWLLSELVRLQNNFD